MNRQIKIFKKYQKKPLPIISWNRPNNATHGVIMAVVDILNGLKPSEVKVYYAKTLNNKRYGLSYNID